MQRRKSKGELIAEIERTRAEEYLGVIEPSESLALDDYRHFDGGAVNTKGWLDSDCGHAAGEVGESTVGIMD